MKGWQGVLKTKTKKPANIKHSSRGRDFFFPIDFVPPWRHPNPVPQTTSPRASTAQQKGTAVFIPLAAPSLVSIKEQPEITHLSGAGGRSGDKATRASHSGCGLAQPGEEGGLMGILGYLLPRGPAGVPLL